MDNIINKKMQKIETDNYQIRSYAFDFKNRLLNNNNNVRKLTSKETDLLKLLFENKNNVLTREFILKTIWGNDNYFFGRSMDVFITRLRKYLKDDISIEIVTIRCIGFKLVI